MPEFTVTGTGTRTTTERVTWSTVVVATTFAAAEQAAQDAVLTGNWDEEDSESLGQDEDLTSLSVTAVERTGDDPEPTPTPATPVSYRSAVGRTGAEGVAVATVETRNGYTPARVRHTPGR